MRREETNMGNFISDLVRTEYYCDFALINAGSFRKNGVIPAGYISTMKLYECFPFNDPIVVLKMKGKVLKEALEWAVGAYPAEEGKFPQISNLNFMFDPKKPAGSRIDAYDIGTESSGLLSMDQEYTVAMTEFTANGGDGFTMFKQPGVKHVVDEENASRIIAICKTFFNSLRTDLEINPKRELARQIRMGEFNVDQEDEIEGVSPDGKYWRLKPEIDDRIYAKEGGDESAAPMKLMRRMTTVRMMSQVSQAP